MTAQDVSTMIRNGQKTIIFLINNGGYTIEVEIHDGPYNVIKNWNYTGLVDAIHNGEGKCWTTKVITSLMHSNRLRNLFLQLINQRVSWIVKLLVTESVNSAGPLRRGADRSD